MTLYKVCLIVGFASLLHVAYSAVQRELNEVQDVLKYEEM